MTPDDDLDRIVITEADLATSENAEIVARMVEAQTQTTVRSVGAPEKKGSSGFVAILLLTGAGIVGGALAFGATKFSDLFLADASSTVSNLAFTFTLAFVIGLTVSIADAASSRSISKVGLAAAIGIPSSVVSGLAVGALANWLYSTLRTNIFEEAQARVGNGESEEAVIAWMNNQNHVPRGLAWMLVGIAAGLTVGIASRSLKRTGLTVIGGLLGGFIGGFIFDFFPQDLEFLSQLIGITITGMLIGLSMGLLEQAAKSRWIDIVEGGFAGKQFILYKNDLTLGSSQQADITLIKDLTIAPLHARIYSNGGRAWIESLNPGMPCAVDGRVETKMELADNSIITIGATKISYREKSAKQTQVGSIGRLA
jgi:hypothetical protein